MKFHQKALSCFAILFFLVSCSSNVSHKETTSLNKDQYNEADQKGDSTPVKHGKNGRDGKNGIFGGAGEPGESIVK